MTRRNQHYPPELREQAVRMVAEVTPNYDSQWAAINAVGQKLGVGHGGDGGQVGPPGRGRRRAATGDYQRRIGGDQAAQAGGRRAAKRPGVSGLPERSDGPSSVRSRQNCGGIGPVRRALAPR